MLQIVRCWLGNHKRDGHKVRISQDGTERSICSGCGRPMIKEYKGATGYWRLTENPFGLNESRGAK